MCPTISWRLEQGPSRNPHRICSMWMTCVKAKTMYGHAKEPTEFDGVQDRGACDFPWSSSRLDWSACGWNGGAPLSSPSSWGWCVTSSVEIWSLSRLYELACVRLESPYQVVQSNTRGVLYSLCWRENGSNVTAWQLLMSHDRGGCSLIPQCNECMKMHIWILGSWCSIRCLYLGTKILYTRNCDDIPSSEQKN